MRRALALLVVCCGPFASFARAQIEPRLTGPSAEPISYEEILPPDPGRRHSVLGVEVRFVLPIPLYARPLCPQVATCVLGVGGGFSIFVERRFRSGFSLGGGYELGLHAVEDVWELSTLQSAGFRGRLILRPRSSGHPVLELGGGLAVLGNVFRFETVGPYVDLGFGAELEMTDSLAFTTGFRIRALTFVPFTTDLDGVRRSVSPYVDLMLSLHAGVAWIGPGAASP